MTPETWQLWIQAGGLIGVAGAGVRYFWDRKEDRAWRRTQFLMELAATFDKEEKAQTAVQVFDGSKETLTRLLGTPVENLSEDDLHLVYCIDRFLDFFDRLYVFVHTTKTLSLEEAMVFGGFLDALEDEDVRAYVREKGYGDVVILADEMANATYEEQAKREQKDRPPT